MKTYEIWFRLDAAICVEAESEEEALDYLNTEEGQEAVMMLVYGTDITVEEVR